MRADPVFTLLIVNFACLCLCVYVCVGESYLVLSLQTEYRQDEGFLIFFFLFVCLGGFGSMVFWYTFPLYRLGNNGCEKESAVDFLSNFSKVLD